MLLTVLVGAGAALWQARIAVLERQRAEDVKNFVAAIFREASPYEGSGTKELTAVDLLKQADKKLDAALRARPGARRAGEHDRREPAGPRRRGRGRAGDRARRGRSAAGARPRARRRCAA